MNEAQLIAGHKAAIESASNCAGEYMASIDKTDLAKCTEAEWYTLLDTIIKNYLSKIDEFPPF